MPPAEQPARTRAPAASAAARARRGAGRCEPEINIMPVRFRPDCTVDTPTGPSPSEAKLLPIQAIGSMLYSCITVLAWKNNKIGAEMGPRSVDAETSMALVATCITAATMLAAGMKESPERAGASNPGIKVRALDAPIVSQGTNQARRRS